MQSITRLARKKSAGNIDVNASKLTLTWKYLRFLKSRKAEGDGSKREGIRQRFKKSQNRFMKQSVSMRNMRLYDAIYVSGNKRSWNRRRWMVIGLNSYQTMSAPSPRMPTHSWFTLDRHLPRFFTRRSRAVLRATRSLVRWSNWRIN